MEKEAFLFRPEAQAGVRNLFTSQWITPECCSILIQFYFIIPLIITLETRDLDPRLLLLSAHI